MFNALDWLCPFAIVIRIGEAVSLIAHFVCVCASRSGNSLL